MLFLWFYFFIKFIFADFPLIQSDGTSFYTTSSCTDCNGKAVPTGINNILPNLSSWGSPNAVWVWDPNFNTPTCPNPITIEQTFTINCFSLITIIANAYTKFKIWINN